MRKLFEKLRDELEAFTEQRDDFVQLVDCSDDDVGFVLQTLREIDGANGSDVFLLFSDPFVDANSFVDVLVDRLRAEHKNACDWAIEQELPPLPAFPNSLDDTQQPPRKRLREGIRWARSLLPQGKGNRLIWGLLPMQVQDWEDYSLLISTLFPWDGVEPWMCGVRVVLRSGPELQQSVPRMAQAPRPRQTEFQLKQEQIQADLTNQANDESLHVEQRMQAILSLAVLDYAYDRLDDANEKYDHLLGHYQSTDNKAMEGFVMNALGDVAHKQGDLEKARYWYECAIAPAAEAKDPMILSGPIHGLGDVSYKEKKYDEAEQYYTELDKLTQASLDAERKARALEWRGLSQEQQQAYDRAEESWIIACDLCRKIGMSPALEVNLTHLARLYKQQDAPTQLQAVEAELEALRNGEATS
ncbi:MAG: hypothetical protein ACFCD0_16860 [Gemmataceae bacterium]